MKYVIWFEFPQMRFEFILIHTKIHFEDRHNKMPVLDYLKLEWFARNNTKNILYVTQWSSLSLISLFCSVVDESFRYKISHRKILSTTLYVYGTSHLRVKSNDHFWTVKDVHFNNKSSMKAIFFYGSVM
jgi:hypothetical protein